jgi:hypothetical protein
MYLTKSIIDSFLTRGCTTLKNIGYEKICLVIAITTGIIIYNITHFK